MRFVNVYIIDGRSKLSRPEAVLARSVDLLIKNCYLNISVTGLILVSVIDRDQTESVTKASRNGHGGRCSAGGRGHVKIDARVRPNPCFLSL